MIRLILPVIFFTSLLFASSNSIQKKILSNKKIFSKNKSKEALASLRIRLLANEISKQSNDLEKLDNKISLINKDINEHKEILVQSKQIFNNLSQTSTKLLKEKVKSEKQIVDTIIDEFSTSIALKLASEKSLEELIDSEIYKLLSKHSKDEILRINNNYTIINKNKKNNEKTIAKTKHYITQREKKKKLLNNLKNKQKKAIKSLENKHAVYQKELKRTLNKQQNLAKLLGKLNILKKEELTKERRRRAKEKKRLIALKEKKRLIALKKKKRQQKYQKNRTKRVTKKKQYKKTATEKYTKNVDIDVRVLGSSTKGVKISKYRGRKTISPLKSFKVIKKFGKYFDPVYKIKLFNESVVLKSNKPKAKVYSILNGKVVYAKKNAGMLENVVIIQHKGGLHTIYSHLDRISPTLKVGKWIKKGYVVGRVDETLTFQATKNSAHINPKDLF